MLVLTRKLGEKIVICGDIEIEIVGVQRNRVRLGVTAPEDARIIRSELRARDSARLDATEIQTRLTAPIVFSGSNPS